MIIAVDYDGTLVTRGVPNRALISQLRHRQKTGDIVILWTCRERKSLQEAVAELRGFGLIPNYINCNCPQAIRMLGHDPRKIYADVYIDDKAKC